MRVAINGFGRIGRSFLKNAIQHKDIEIVAINDLTDTKTLSHLLKYDSVHGKFSGDISYTSNEIVINGKKIPVTAIKEVEKLPWKEFNVDIVLESTGLFLDKENAEKHLKAGAKKVLLSAPPKTDDIKAIVIGVNDHILTKDDVIVSNASCTTNCAAPMIKVVMPFGIESGYVSTIHAYTADQRLHDAPHKDLRRARAAAVNIVPTSTGAAKAVTKIFPELKGKLGGCGIRVPVSDGSLTDITLFVKNPPKDKSEVNELFKKYAEGELKGILQYSDEPLVSSDIVGNPHSVVFDSEFTSVIGNMIKLIGWYDNEWGYSNRLVDLIKKMYTL
ncbi:MAG: glyceraldehyde-3-phosphate dehydrogenase [Bacteroidia bacterium]|nr:MAG: glyceraldehyde-3-phosphate dehydrogenase [Bacteroidia bacterium]